MRHFGHGVGHLRYERQHEIDPDPSHDNSMELNLDEEDELHNDSDSEEMMIDDEDQEGDESERSDIISDPDSSEPECDSDSDGYVSY